MKDHLGNVRVAFTTTGTKVRQVNSYYPFGMNISGLTATYNTTTKNKYLYNGKEMQDDFGLNLLDYGARFYDAVLGRWHSVDPLAEKYAGISSYAYCVNNPIVLVDPDGREPITLSILAARAIIGGAIGAGIDIAVQMTVNMTIQEQTFSEAFANLDWTSVGASAITGAIGMPGANVISKTAKAAIVATTVAVDAAVDVSIAEGNQNIFNGEKSLTTASIDAVGSLIGGKASDDIVRGARSSISNDISSGTFSTFNKAEKNILRQTHSVVNSQGFEAGTKATVGLVTEVGKQGVKSIVGSGNPSSAATRLMQNYTQPSDNTRVARPIYPLSEFK